MFDGPKTMGPRNDHPLPIPPVYGFHEAKKAIKEDSGRVILVEGEVDVWQMVSEGFNATIGTFGTSFGRDGLDFLSERGIREVVLLADADKAGKKFSARIASLHHPTLRIKIATLDVGDPDETIARDGPDAIQNAIDNACYGIEYLVGLALSKTVISVTDKIDLLLDLKSVVAEAPKVDQALAIQMLSEALALDAASIQDVFLDLDPGETQLHDRKSERTILANMLQSAEFAGRAIQDLDAMDFHMVRHAQVFTAISTLYRAGHEITVDTVAITLERAGAESAIKVLDSVAGLGTTMGAEFLIGSIREKSMRRQMVAIGRGLLADSSNPTIAPDLIAQAHMSHIARVVVGEDRGRTIDRLVDGVIDILHERMKNPSLIIGHDLGRDWQSLNRTIHGLQPGRLMVVAAPSGVGKTSAMIGMASQICVQNAVPGLILTLETDDKTLTSRLISHRSEVELEAIATGHVSKEDIALLHGAAAQIAASPLQIMQRGRTLEEAQALIRHDHMVRGTEVVWLDYVQLMRLADPGKNTRRDVELGMISEGLLTTALELNVAIVALAQINREGAKKHTKADHTDIAEAFKIAQDSDIFMTIMEKTDEEIEIDGAERGNRRARISKNRRDGKVGVTWDIMASLDVQRMREVIS
jgi:replicative DNA helicase